MLRFVPRSRRYRTLISACLAVCASFIGNTIIRAEQKPKNVGSIARLDPAVDKLLPPDAKMEVVGEGYAWCEGPVWVPEHHFLLFSDIPNNAIMRWDSKLGSKLFL